MIWTVDSIGNFRFRHWLGPCPPRPRQEPQVLSYHGANYQSVRLAGLRTEPFTRDSIIDQPSIASCRLLYSQYCNLIGSIAQRLVWQNYDFDQEQLRVHVLECELIGIEQRLLICNPLVAGNTVDLTCRWKMIFSPR